MHLEFRLDAFNVFNHPQFGDINSGIQFDCGGLTPSTIPLEIWYARTDTEPFPARARRGHFKRLYASSFGTRSALLATRPKKLGVGAALV